MDIELTILGHTNLPQRGNLPRLLLPTADADMDRLRRVLVEWHGLSSLLAPDALGPTMRLTLVIIQ